MEQAWDIFKEVHDETVEKYEFESHAFVLMINHYHWLNSTPHENIDDGMRYFQSETSRRIAKSAGRINKIWGGRYGWSVIPTQNFYQISFRYVYMNPVRAMICQNPIQYTWSTLTKSEWNLVQPPGFSDGMPDTPEDRGQWMLDLRPQDDEHRTRAALRRKIFDLPRDKRGFK